MMMSVLFSWKIQYINRNMLERYVTDEFKAVDKDFSNSMYTLRFKSSKKRKFFHILPPAGGRHATEVTSVNASYF